MSFIEQYLLQLNTVKRRWRCAVVILTALSLIVALVTVWNLRMTGVTIANSASCGYEEHQHTEQCSQNAENGCGIAEHIHMISCYSLFINCLLFNSAYETLTRLSNNGSSRKPTEFPILEMY